MSSPHGSPCWPSGGGYGAPATRHTRSRQQAASTVPGCKNNKQLHINRMSINDKFCVCFGGGGNQIGEIKSYGKITIKIKGRENNEFQLPKSIEYMRDACVNSLVNEIAVILAIDKCVLIIKQNIAHSTRCANWNRNVIDTNCNVRIRQGRRVFSAAYVYHKTNQYTQTHKRAACHTHTHPQSVPICIFLFFFEGFSALWLLET